ncbi:MAG: hypothetical protein ACK5UX_04695 [Burkholderiales bacterium]
MVRAVSAGVATAVLAVVVIHVPRTSGWACEVAASSADTMIAPASRSARVNLEEARGAQ